MIDNLTRSILEQRDNIENQRNRELNSNREHYIKQLETEIQQLKENNMSMQEEMVRTWKKADLYKEVIEEVRELRDQFIDENELLVWENDSLINFVNKLLQILDKVKGMSNE